MSGSGIPYHLRTNKAIDRDLFFELLNHLELESKITDYQYISLGGPMLEDMRILHQRLGLENLISIEKDASVITRQEFNKPFQCITAENKSTRVFIDDFTSNQESVVWLDYTNTAWRAQFEECHTLIQKLGPYDILKITVNANPDCVKDENGDVSLDKFMQKASSPYTSENLIENDIMTLDRLAQTLADIFETVADSALDAEPDLELKPLSLFRYIDGRHQMLTVSGIVYDCNLENDFDDFISRSKLDDWPHFSGSWQNIHEIAVPDLTTREKLAINQLLPATGHTINANDLPFKLHKNSVKNQKIIDNYIKYYRYIPNFQRLAI